MNRRKFLKDAGLTALVLSTGCNLQPPKMPEKSPYKFEQITKKKYDNSNCNLDDRKLEEFVESVEYLSVKVIYESSNSQDTESWMGSGTVIHEDNLYQYILTAGHVAIADKKQKGIFGSLTGRTLKSTKIIIPNKSKLEFICGLNNNKLDYALLRARKNKKLKTMRNKLGNSASLGIGDYVYAMGYPLGTGLAVTGGNISSVDRYDVFGYPKDKKFVEQFMFTSPISPGNSGGPVMAIHKNELYLVGIGVAAYISGQNLNIAVKINNILKSIKSK